MKRRSKLIFSLISLCFSIAVLCFGVYSALSVSYSINGSVSYEIQDVFVELDLSVYRALSTTPVNSATHNQNVSTIKGAGKNISETDFGKLSYTDHESTYEKGEVKPGNEDGIFEAYSENLALTYGSPTNDNQGYAFYIVIDIYNLGSEIINAQITTAPTSLENTILRDSGNVEIAADDTERIVLGLALDDVTTGIKSAGFTYTITISRGELPAEPITDMLFSVNEATGTATLFSYADSGSDVVIPESIGYNTLSSMTSTLMTVEDITSNYMNQYYFYQDLYITLPNQEKQLIENPKIWLNENMESIQATPEDYIPMIIQAVESYTIDQEDYNKYATLDQDAPMSMPIQMIIGGLLYNSVDVQYGTNGQPFTFNMENYNAAMTGDNSPTSKAIRDFMSKDESDPESLLPVTYSNFEYKVVVKGGEYSVTSIASSAFKGCGLTSIEIPSSVTNIGSFAFSDCSDLKTVTFGANSQLESIGSNAFNNCDALTSIEIPSSVTSIGEAAFYDCDALKTVTFEEDSQLESIGSSAFRFCSNLTSIEIPSSVTSIGSYAFQFCSDLEIVTFKDTTTEWL